MTNKIERKELREYLRVKETAAYLGCSVPTVNQAVGAGHGLEALRTGIVDQLFAGQVMTTQHIDLAERASALYPDNPSLQEKWIAAVAFLRSKGLWILEGGPAKWRAA